MLLLSFFCCCFRCFCCCFRCFCCCFRFLLLLLSFFFAASAACFFAAAAACFFAAASFFLLLLLFFFAAAAAVFLLLLLFFFCCCCCFFYSDTTENKTTESESWKLAPQSRKPSITEDLIHQRHVPSGWCWAGLQQGRGESASCAARQDVAPSPSPSSLRACLQDKWHLPGSGLGESTQKLGSLGGPPATHLSTKVNEACPPALTCKLRVRTFLPSSSLLQSRTIHGRCSGSRCAIAAHGRHHCCVYGQLRALPQCEAVGDHLKPAPIKPVVLPRSRSRTNTSADTRVPASRHTWAAAHSSKNPLLPRTPASAHAARWCPRMSSWRPHRQVREHKGMGRRRRQQRRRRNDCESIIAWRLVGRAV